MNNFHRQTYFVLGIAGGVAFTWAAGPWWGIGLLLTQLFAWMVYAFALGYVRFQRNPDGGV